MLKETIVTIGAKINYYSGTFISKNNEIKLIKQRVLEDKY